MQSSNGTINPAALSSSMPIPNQVSFVAHPAFDPRYAPSNFADFSDDNYLLSRTALTSKSLGLANQTVTPDTSPRGVKRSRSPENVYGDLPQSDQIGEDGTFLLSGNAPSLYLQLCDSFAPVQCIHVLCATFPVQPADAKCFADHVSI